MFVSSKCRRLPLPLLLPDNTVYLVELSFLVLWQFFIPDKLINLAIEFFVFLK